MDITFKVPVDLPEFKGYEFTSTLSEATVYIIFGTNRLRQILTSRLPVKKLRDKEAE